MLSLYFSTLQIISKDSSKLKIELVDMDFPVYMCVTVEDPYLDPAEGPMKTLIEMTTPIIAVVSPYDKAGKRLASQMHYTDEKKRCFSTGGLWTSEATKTQVEFAWDG